MNNEQMDSDFSTTDDANSHQEKIASKKESKSRFLESKLLNAAKSNGFLKRILSIPDKLIEHWHQLDGTQKVYLFALAILIINSEDINASSDINATMGWVGALAIFAMGRELWSIFTRIWESTFGKSVILILYAIIANLTLAVASQKINSIVGVAPSTLIYTQGLTTIMMLPFWILFLSLVALTFIFIGAQVRGVLFYIIRKLHIHRFPIKAKEHLPGVFVVIRLVLLPIVLMTLGSTLSWYSDQIGLINVSIKWDNEEDESDIPKDVILLLDKAEGHLETPLKFEEYVQLQKELEDYSLNLDKLDKDTIDKIRQGDGLILANPNDKNLVDKIIAEFVFNYETFEKSRCVLNEGERAVPVNENDILVVVEDDTLPLGYRFSSRECVLKSSVMDATPVAQENDEIGLSENSEH